MKTIITGATGAIGVALVKKLIADKNEVLIIARKNSKRNENIPKSPFIKLIYASLNELRNLDVQEQGYDTFYHLAWDGTTGADRNDLSKQCNNIQYAIDAVNLAAKLGCKTFVGVGSQAEYGRSQEILSPQTKTNPENGYGVAKLCAGQMTALQAAALGIRHIWVRVLSVYGPCDGPQSLVMSTIERARRGDVICCTKGEQIWDYLFSDDAAEVLYLLGKKTEAQGIYVLGNGVGRPLSDYIKDIRNTIDSNVSIDFGAIPYAKNQVMFLKADITKLQQDVGWTPKTEFCSGIKAILKSLQ